jgi:hypothetical protein
VELIYPKFSCLITVRRKLTSRKSKENFQHIELARFLQTQQP